MLGSPLGAVVAATDPSATRAFLTGLGAAIDGPRGWVDVVPGGGSYTRGPFEGGPAALDFYARSVDNLPHETVELGPLVMHQARVTGPDGLPVVLIEANHRRASRLDTDSACRVSEAHSLVWVVPDLDATLGFFRQAGLQVVFDVPVVSDAVCALMDLPAGTAVRMAMVGDEALQPMRFELFEVPGASSWNGDITAGTVWPVLAGSPGRLPWASVQQRSAGTWHCVAPGGVLVELRA